ncbi:glycerophosphodiester phosphodiesterase [Conexibacter sp. JD483]|uniref:glycerophosphodiester phosphodiesterase n=1 Tax=unclassified Conexibacter TaxID=2627773 RepID=UPI002726100B|nr:MULTISPECIES: glycerophosphodiester phosphodiesterase [unclassified Conexibacter]MDO8186543.1 glycerophosphodiester phosphodiesterase [Conexibacter sp. CPCC 205706]MDO8200112.1 glycerophosphodiester phosphodiesterase [Conexibacter sp. CPCC 205762]MDR9371994.1 glycerophosphodiester phosphodiesterase [Conexibacter sp. JD483]
MRSTLTIAHRGGLSAAPENSLEAFEHAIAIGAEMIELDVRRSADGVLIVHHDPHVAGIPTASLCAADIALRLGRRPPTLAEALDLARGRIAVDVELKEDGCSEQALAQIRDRRLGPEEVVLTSFRDAVVRDCRQLAPELRAGLLLGARTDRPGAAGVSELVLPAARLQRADASFAAPHVALTRLGVLKQIAAIGLPSVVWTVNSPRTLDALYDDDRVEGIITDRPELALAVRSERARASRAA